jgi:chemotaxis methyl-accepting protein methylase
MFAQHNVVLDPLFTRLDMLVCRNLLIYFDQTLQRTMLP